MEIRDLHIPAAIVWSEAPAAVAACCAELGLLPALRTELKSHAGGVHWHYRRPRAAGTLEITISETASRIWIKVHAGRRADWIPDAVERLSALLDERLRTGKPF
jgi:hypothetical protein